jgi:hypothetical protein
MKNIQTSRWHIYAALWSFIFALISFYWGIGGTIGLETLGEGIKAQALAGDPEILLVNWIGVFGKVLIGLLALAAGRRWLLPRLNHGLRLGLWIAGGLLALYGSLNLVQHILMLTGIAPIARSLGSLAAVRWHLFLWDPWWLLGGILFLLAASKQLRNAAMNV